MCNRTFEILLFVLILFLSFKLLTWTSTEVERKKSNRSIIGPYQTFQISHILYQAAIITKLSNSSHKICGGSVISTIFVLTVAHCLQRYEVATVIVNSRTSQNHTIVQKVLKSKRIILHPEWQGDTFVNDIALIELPKRLLQTEITPLTLPEPHGIRTKTGRIIGFQRISRNKIVLKKHTVKIIANRECRMYYGSLIRPTNICASNKSGSKSGCHGFSGSPLVVNSTLIGLVSFGTDKCSDGYPVAYTRIFKYKNWIKKYYDTNVYSALQIGNAQSNSWWSSRTEK